MIEQAHAKAVIAVAVAACSLNLLGCGPYESLGLQKRPQCSTREPEPLGINQVRMVLRNHGFNVEVATDPPCTPTMVAELANIHFSGPHRNLDRSEEIIASEGHIICTIEDENVVTGQRVYEERDELERAVFAVANVDCYLYPDARQANAQVARLERAFEELARLATAT